MRIWDIKFPIIIISLTIGSVIINTSYGQENQTSTTYENANMGIRLSHPSDWGRIVEFEEERCSTDPHCVVGILSEPFRGNIVINKWSKESCECDSFMEFVKWVYKADQLKEGFSFIDDNQTKIGKNHTGWQYEYSYIQDGVDTTGHSVFVTNNNNFYAILVSYPNELGVKRLPEFNKLIESIEFLPEQIPKIPSFMNMNETEQEKPNSALESSPNGLQILSHNSFTDDLGYMHVVGEIRNNYPSTATFVKIIGTFYDADNQVVATDFTFANPYDIGSGQKAPFELTLTSASFPVSQIDHYELQASSQ